MTTDTPLSSWCPKSGQLLDTLVRAFRLDDPVVGGIDPAKALDRTQRTVKDYFAGKWVGLEQRAVICRAVASALLNSGVVEAIDVPRVGDAPPPEIDDVLAAALVDLLALWIRNSAQPQTSGRTSIVGSQRSCSPVRSSSTSRFDGRARFCFTTSQHLLRHCGREGRRSVDHARPSQRAPSRPQRRRLRRGDRRRLTNGRTMAAEVGAGHPFRT